MLSKLPVHNVLELLWQGKAYVINYSRQVLQKMYFKIRILVSNQTCITAVLALLFCFQFISCLCSVVTIYSSIHAVEYFM